jgi:hypothetical protein
MSPGISPNEAPWLRRFFSGQNQLTWQEIESGRAEAGAMTQVTPWLRFLGGSTIDNPIVLPVLFSNGDLTWYGVATSDQLFSQLVEEVGSFIGPSYSDFQSWDPSPPGNSEQDLALAERFGSRVIRFSALRTQDRSEIERALLLYQSLLVRRPSMPDRTQRPFGKIRGDFDRALLAGNAVSAKGFLDELMASGRIDAGQQKCLEVRLLAGLGRKEELARNQPLISSVAELALPTQTLIDVVNALYETYIRPIEANPNLGEVFGAFRQHIFRPFGSSLFRDRKGIRHPVLLKAFLLFELIQPEPSAKRCKSIVSAYAENAEGRDLVEQWYASASGELDDTLPTIQVQTSLELARQAIADEDYATAAKLCFDLLPGYWAYSALLRCATELRSIEITNKVLEAVSAASCEVRALFKPKDHARIETLQLASETSNSETPDSGWIGWAQGIQIGIPVTKSISILNESISSWSVDEYAHDFERCSLFAQLIGNANADQEVAYRDAFPFMVDFFVDQPDQPCRAFTPIYANLIKILAWSGALSVDELEIASSLTLALLSTGPTLAVYAECMEDAREILSANRSPANLDWALNLAELLALYPPQDDGHLRLRIFTEVISIVSIAPHRVTSIQRAILQLLGKDYSCTSLLESLPRDDNEDDNRELTVATDFNGLIGIYTLTEGAGQRAKAILEGNYPNAQVETNKDHEATERLVSLAKNADIFVFAWKSSKHQAYYCVKSARGTKELLLPTGKGSASIVKSILDRIRTE